MPNIATVVSWLLSGNGRLTCAALLFVLMWAIKNVPWVKTNLLTTDARKRLAVIALAAAPAVALSLVSNEGTEQTILQTFLTAVVGAMGLHNLTSKKQTKSATTTEKKPNKLPADEDNDT